MHTDLEVPISPSAFDGSILHAELCTARSDWEPLVMNGFARSHCLEVKGLRSSNWQLHNGHSVPCEASSATLTSPSQGQMYAHHHASHRGSRNSPGSHQLVPAHSPSLASTAQPEVLTNILTDTSKFWRPGLGTPRSSETPGSRLPWPKRSGEQTDNMLVCWLMWRRRQAGGGGRSKGQYWSHLSLFTHHWARNSPNLLESSWDFVFLKWCKNRFNFSSVY